MQFLAEGSELPTTRSESVEPFLLRASVEPGYTERSVIHAIQETRSCDPLHGF